MVADGSSPRSAPNGESGADAPPARAVALRYARPRSGSADGADGGAPRVVARGRGFVAERILELAREHGVPVREDPDLVELLSACEVGESIPVEVWSAVAEVLVWVYGLGRDPDARAVPEPRDGA